MTAKTHHNYTMKAPAGTGFTVEVSPTTLYGWFEHDTRGDNCGGGLWFHRFEGGELELFDADGTPSLPANVAKALADMGIRVDDIFCANDETFPVNPVARDAEIARFKAEGK